MILKKKPFLEIIFLIIISAVVYLPNIRNLTYFKDEWYYMYDAYIAGANVFRHMFSVDRPARGIFLEIYYLLFGPQALPYHISGYLWRIVSMIGAFWSFNILWPRERRFAFFTALLFALYPGYFWWISAIEYQPQIASLALQVVSIALTLKAVQSSEQTAKIAYLVGAILTGWAYIALVDYAIGVEVFRFLCVYVLVNRDGQFSSVWKRLYAFMRAWAWNLLIPLGFLWWRTFIFSNERKATDIGLQLEVFFNAPMPTASNWFLHFYNSLLSLSMLAWVAQFQRFFLRLHLQDMVYGYTIAVIVLLLIFLADRFINQSVAPSDPEPSANLYREALLIGALGMIFGIFPVILANRYINLEIYSHYSLPVSLPATIFLSGLIYIINSRPIRFVLFCILIMLAVLTHYSIPKYALDEENAIETYWWQVSWRVPGLRPDATLVTLYPNGIGGAEDSFMEAANMIYFPDQRKEIPVRYFVSAVMPNNENTEFIIIGHHRKKDGYRSHTFILNYSNVVVLSQPTPASCVRVIDGTRYLLSESDPENIRLLAPYSRIENVRANLASQTPQEFAFGPEPALNWCFYFEKADLAVQKFDWKEAAKLGDDVIRLELHPEDQVEWFPFLQAYAMVGDEEKVKTVSANMNTRKFLSDQVCILFNRPDSVLTLSLQMKTLVTGLFCK